MTHSTVSQAYTTRPYDLGVAARKVVVVLEVLEDRLDESAPKSSARRIRIASVIAVVVLLVVSLAVGIVALNRATARSRLAASNIPAVSGVTSTPTSSAPIQVRLVLDETTAKAGDEIRGELFITNTTTSPILSDGVCNGLVQVGLANANVPFPVAWHLVRCPGVAIGLGTTEVPVTIQTTYPICEQGPPAAGFPSCAMGTSGTWGMPVLPAGVYHTEIAFNLTEAIALPAPIQVTLTR